MGLQLEPNIYKQAWSGDGGELPEDAGRRRAAFNR